MDERTETHRTESHRIHPPSGRLGRILKDKSEHITPLQKLSKGFLFGMKSKSLSGPQGPTWSGARWQLWTPPCPPPLLPVFQPRYSCPLTPATGRFLCPRCPRPYLLCGRLLPLLQGSPSFTVISRERPRHGGFSQFSISELSQLASQRLSEL